MKKLTFILASIILWTVPALAEPAEGNPIASEVPSGGGGTNYGSKVSNPDGYYKGYPYVDLGLPSGTKWATYNVGASSPEEFGTYFAWGETSSKYSYDKDNSVPYKHRDEAGWLKRNNWVDYNLNLTTAHDAAAANWGGSWRMFTQRDVDELVANTSHEWTTYRGVPGILIRSNVNGKTIFMPASGRIVGTERQNVNSEGCYWNSTLDTSRVMDNCSGGFLYLFYFSASNFDPEYSTTWFYAGRSVRAVYK